MKRYTTLPREVKATQFTREMAEGSEPLPDGVIMAMRSLGPDKRFPERAAHLNYAYCHTHFVETGAVQHHYYSNSSEQARYRIAIGEWVVEDNGTRFIYSDADFHKNFSEL